MKRLSAICAIPAVVISLAISAACAEGIDGREILGIRLGSVIGSTELDEAFGKGSELELHFIEGIGSWYGVGVSVSAHYFGSSKSVDKNIEFLGTDRDLKLHIYSLTAALVTMNRLAGDFSISAEAGGGLYTINGIVPAGLYEGSITRNRLGIYGGAGLYYNLNRYGLSLNISGKFHHIFSGDGWNNVIYSYTGLERADMIQLTVGVILFTG